MAGHHKYSELRARMSPESRARAERKSETMLAAIQLRDLARERGLKQEELAERLNRAQASVSRTLRREDMHVSTLREVVEAMGGELEITARFPDQAYRIDQFAQSDA
jgi:transcriptional regulator with XRE-family HTH domain